MRYIFLALLVNMTSAISLFSLGPEFNSLAAFEEWEDFKQNYDKSYESQEEENLRFFIFHANKKEIDDHNDGFHRGEYNFTMEVNHFADLLSSEFSAKMNGFRPQQKTEDDGSATFLRLSPEIELPASVDWRQVGAVTAVQDQGDCGSCWAFSANGALEGQHFRKTGRLVNLSEQNLIDCSRSFGTDGCDGGRMRDAFRYVHEQGGVDTETAYPYQGDDDNACRFSRRHIGATDVGFVGIPAGEEEALMDAVAVHGPVSIAVDASRPTFQFYHSGVYGDPSCSSTSLNHAMLAVGYGTNEFGRDFWLIKNSWSTGWGEGGYVRIERNNNECGVANNAVFPLV